MSRPFYRAEPVHEDIYFVVGQATHDGPLYEVDQCRGWDAACAIIDRLNATAEGLRRIGVSVAVWAGMAAAQEPLRDEIAIVRRWVEHWRESAGKWKELAFARSKDLAAARILTRMQRFTIADAEADLDAERAARRKWELRLRWRAQNSYEQRHPDLDDIDRLYRHEVCAQRDPQKNTERLGSGITRFRWYFDAARRLPIAGPRGVLP